MIQLRYSRWRVVGSNEPSLLSEMVLAAYGELAKAHSDPLLRNTIHIYINLPLELPVLNSIFLQPNSLTIARLSTRLSL